MNNVRNQLTHVAGQRSESLPANLTRRAFLFQTAFAGLAIASPWAEPAFAAAPHPPSIGFRKNSTRDGIIGPFGELRILKINGAATPVVVTAAKNLAVLNCAVRNPFVRFGPARSRSKITLTADGIRYGSKKQVAWSHDAVRKLIDAISKDRTKARGAMLLRSTLHSSLPVAALTFKSTIGTGVGGAIAKGAVGFAHRGSNCKVQRVTDSVVTTITEVIDSVKTAKQQWDECFDKAVSTGGDCSGASFATAACAAILCSAKTFLDIVVGLITIVTKVVEEVVRIAVKCVRNPFLSNNWPNPWDIDTPVITAAIPQPLINFSRNDIAAGIGVLNQISEAVGGLLGPFGNCLLKGKWSLAQVDTRLNLAGGNIVIPYGIKVCITSSCAKRLSADQILTELETAWVTALSVMAALSADFAAVAAPLGITASSAAATIVSGLGGAAVTGVAASPAIVVAAIILGFILWAMIYATAISAQLYFQKTFTNHFADGLVCIEHPTFALALFSAATLGVGSVVNLIPPIVTG